MFITFKQIYSVTEGVIGREAWEIGRQAGENRKEAGENRKEAGKNMYRRRRK